MIDRMLAFKISIESTAGTLELESLLLEKATIEASEKIFNDDYSKH